MNLTIFIGMAISFLSIVEYVFINPAIKLFIQFLKIALTFTLFGYDLGKADTKPKKSKK